MQLPMHSLGNHLRLFFFTSCRCTCPLSNCNGHCLCTGPCPSLSTCAQRDTGSNTCPDAPDVGWMAPISGGFHSLTPLVFLQGVFACSALARQAPANCVFTDRTSPSLARLSDSRGCASIAPVRSKGLFCGVRNE